jgi:hypothetical protein
VIWFLKVDARAAGRHLLTVPHKKLVCKKGSTLVVLPFFFSCSIIDGVVKSPIYRVAAIFQALDIPYVLSRT